MTQPHHTGPHASAWRCNRAAALALARHGIAQDPVIADWIVEIDA